MNLYAYKKVLVTGGLGFIGSNLALRLVQLGARVTIVDSCVTECGGNYRNIDSIAGNVDVVEADIGDTERVRPLLKCTDMVFNLAGEVSHTHSMEFPERDLELNTRSQLKFLFDCARERPGLRVVYACTRQVYGKPKYLPVDESHPVAPVDVNGVHKHASCLYHQMFNNIGLLDVAILRLTNVYGPRLALNVPCQGVLSTFFSSILLDQRIELYGDGSQLRDPLYVDDAVDAMLRVGATPALKSMIYNVGGPQPLALEEIAGILCQMTGAPTPHRRPFPPERARIDIGSYVSDSGLIWRDLGWRPTISFERGAARTLDFFRLHLSDYLGHRRAKCGLKRPTSDNSHLMIRAKPASS